MALVHVVHIICQLPNFIQNAPIIHVEPKNMVLAIILNERTRTSTQHVMCLKIKHKCQVKPTINTTIVLGRS